MIIQSTVHGHLSISHQDNQLGFIVGQEICCYNNVGLVWLELCQANTWCCTASWLHPRSHSAMAPSHLHLNTSLSQARSTNTQPVKTKINTNINIGLRVHFTYFQSFFSKRLHTKQVKRIRNLLKIFLESTDYIAIAESTNNQIAWVGSKPKPHWRISVK